MTYIVEDISASELLRRYNAGGRRFSNLDITDDGSDVLVGASLDGIELIECFLTASCRGASLKGAVVHANVKTCDFTGADLTGADFRGSAICGATFTGAIMREADFVNAHAYGHVMKQGELPDW